MQKENKFKDLINITSGIFNSLEGVKNQSKNVFKSKITRTLKNLDVINREEFNEIKAMIVKAREDNSRLEKKIKNLENKIKKS